MTLFDRAIARTLPAVPRPIVRRISARYIAGPELADACRAVRQLNESGRRATVAVLGEEIETAGEAEEIARLYHDVLEAAEREELDANVSVKPSALGLLLDFGLCRALLRELVEDAAGRSSFVRIDMEDATTTDDTFRLYRELRDMGLDNVGLVLQAYLRRTLADVDALADLRPNVRLCKGIYVEPARIAFQEPDEVRSGFLDALDRLLALGSYVGIATHDERLIGESLRLLGKHGRGPDEYEFQMLLGVRPERAGELVADGNPLRVYVPFGRQWYEYSLRRLQENPAVAGHVASDVARRVLDPFGLLRGRR